MKRSEINAIMKDAKRFIDAMNFKLPLWAYWLPSDWKGKYDSCAEIVDNMLGWDITDFGHGDYHKQGLFLFTIRNGNLAKGDKKTYAEKLLIVEEEQETPMHFHWSKMEDIINRGGGNLVIQLYQSSPEEGLSDEPLEVKIDGVKRSVNAGDTVVLTPGESICLEQDLYHLFYGEKGKGTVLVGEVSMVNDDNSDNKFHKEMGRFPVIEEDEEPLHLLVNDYAKYL